MCVKKSFQIINYPKRQSQQTIDEIIISIIKNQSRAVSISYIITKVEFEVLPIYKAINRLISNKILERVYSSVCPVCGTENLLKQEDEKVQCDFCKEYYLSCHIEEKFKLKI